MVPKRKGVGLAETRANMCAIHAKVGRRPPGKHVLSPRSLASCFISGSLTGNPAAETFATTSLGVPLALMAKYWPGCSTQAAINAISATIISVTIAP